MKFDLTSDQLELLLAFANSKGLSDLSNKMAKDPSVVSRNLQRIAEDHPVIEKVKGRWVLTSLGEQTNEITKSSLKQYSQLLGQNPFLQSKAQGTFKEKSVLMIINAQNGLLDSTLAGRNNSEAERNILKLLVHWRLHKRPVIHVKHVSDHPKSVFLRNTVGCEILKPLSPIESEIVIEKSQSSAFSSDQLNEVLNALEPENILIVGFTANECVDSSARDSSGRGFSTYVIGDATAMFDIEDANGKLLKADRVHKLTLANINAFYAKVINTSDAII